MSATSGPRSCESLARWNPASSSWKMSQDTFGWDSTEFSETLPTSGSMRSGALYARPMLERPTEGSVSSSWPTPQNRDWRSPDLEGSGNLERKRAKGWTEDLNSKAANWPTAGANDWKGTAKVGQRRGQLDEAAEQMWHGRQDPTPTGSGSRSTSGLRLNPRFVEWLMGFPGEWTVCEPLATP